MDFSFLVLPPLGYVVRRAMRMTVVKMPDLGKHDTGVLFRAQIYNKLPPTDLLKQ